MLVYFSVEDHGIEEWYQPKSAMKKLKKEEDNTDEPKAMFKEADSHESDDSDDNNLSSDDEFWTEGIHLACKIGSLSTRQRSAIQMASHRLTDCDASNCALLVDHLWRHPNGVLVVDR